MKNPIKLTITLENLTRPEASTLRDAYKEIMEEVVKGMNAEATCSVKVDPELDLVTPE